MDKEQQRDQHDELRRERDARGETRDAHLEAGRARARNQASPPGDPSTPSAHSDEDSVDAEQIAILRAGRDAEAAMKAAARSRYDGTDEAFEREWPTIRKKLRTAGMDKTLEDNRRGF